MPRKVGVVGAGTIGPDIAYYLLSAIPGLEVVLVDIVQEALDKAAARIAAQAKKGVAKGKVTEAQAAAIATGLRPTLDYAALADCDWVLEAATENLELKRKIFAQVESIVRPDAIITSNTSSLPASLLFSAMKHPERTTITHYFAPAFQNPAVEIIRWAKGAPEVLEHLRWLSCQTGKVPLVTEDVLCFMLDRVFDNWCNEAVLMLDRASASEIDSVALEVVHAGPFQVLNMARGNPITYEANHFQADEEGEHYRPAELFKSVDTWKTIAPRKPVPVKPEVADAVRDRLHAVLFSQSFDIVDRGIASAADLEMGCRLALGFKKGPFELMREAGETETKRRLDRFASERPGHPMPKGSLAGYQSFRRSVLVDDLDGVKVLTIRRPEVLNALDDRVTGELLDALVAHEKDPSVQGFVIVGYGPRAFSAGADIGRFPEVLGRHDAAVEYSRECSRLLRHLDDMGKPVVAALNGMALGGGFELAMRCHALVAAKDAWMQLPEVTLGIAPGIGGMVVPFRRWPRAAAAFHDMVRTARRMKAKEAAELGIVEGLADSYPALVRLAADKARALAGAVPRIPNAMPEVPAPSDVEPVAATGQPLSREVVAILTRAMASAAKAPSLADALEIGYAAFADTACTAAAKEGIAAFVEGRKADFTTTG